MLKFFNKCSRLKTKLNMLSFLECILIFHFLSFSLSLILSIPISSILSLKLIYFSVHQANSVHFYLYIYLFLIVWIECKDTQPFLNRPTHLHKHKWSLLCYQEEDLSLHTFSLMDFQQNCWQEKKYFLTSPSSSFSCSSSLLLLLQTLFLLCLLFLQLLLFLLILHLLFFPPFSSRNLDKNMKNFAAIAILLWLVVLIKLYVLWNIS